MPIQTNPLPFTLIVEDGTGLTNSNSYATLAEADAYFASQLYASDWTGQTNDIKARALGMATTLIDRMVEFRGYRKGTEQALEWPRLECPRVGLSEFTFVATIRRLQSYWDEDKVPYILANAAAEMAKILLQGDTTVDDPSKGIQSLGLGNGAIAITFNPGDRKIALTDQASYYLRQLGRIRGARSSVSIKRVQ